MRVALYLSLLSSLFYTLSAQTVSSIRNDSLHCCSDSLYFDFKGNGGVDLIFGTMKGLDFRGFDAFVQDPKMTFACCAVDSGQPYMYSHTPLLNLALTSIGCWWSNRWVPGVGSRYLGFYRANSPGDTTFGWVKLDFLGVQNDCYPIMLIEEVAYNLKSNLHLPAGQKLGVDHTPVDTTDFGLDLESKNIDRDIIAYPNPTEDLIKIKIPDVMGGLLSIHLYDNAGTEVYYKQTTDTGLILEMQDMAPGIYLLRISNSSNVITQRIERK